MVASIRDAPAGYMSPGYDKARTVGLDKEKAKVQAALVKFTSERMTYKICDNSVKLLLLEKIHTASLGGSC